MEIWRPMETPITLQLLHWTSGLLANFPLLIPSASNFANNTLCVKFCLLLLLSCIIRHLGNCGFIYALTLSNFMHTCWELNTETLVRQIHSVEVHKSYLGLQVQRSTCCYHPYCAVRVRALFWILPAQNFVQRYRQWQLGTYCKGVLGNYRHWQLEEYMAVLPLGTEELNCRKRH